ncbi:MAG TPA: hypothetical protein VMC08_04995, partial [Bacteroidales bacterium]|nr:hypothetical protein [Bacteroidales bacterium]
GWIRQSIQRFFCTGEQNLHLLVNRFFYLTLFSIATGGLVLACLLYLMFSLGLSEILLVVTYFSLYTIFLFHLSVHRARQQDRAAAFSEGIYQVFNLGFIAYLVVHLGLYDYRVMFIAMTAGLLLTEIGRLIFVSGTRERVEIIHLFWDLRFTQKVVEYGRPMTLWLVLSFTLSVADRFILKLFHGFATAGAYSAISDLLQIVVTLFCMPVLLSYHPKIVELWNTSHRRESMQLIRDAVIFDFLIGLVLFIAVMILRDEFYSGFLGIHDKGIYAVSVFLVINSFLWQIILLFQKPLELFARRKFKNAAVLVTLVINLAGNFIFVPRFGYYASAIVMFCSYVIYLVLIFVLYRNLARETADQHVSR